MMPKSTAWARPRPSKNLLLPWCRTCRMRPAQNQRTPTGSMGAVYLPAFYRKNQPIVAIDIKYMDGMGHGLRIGGLGRLQYVFLNWQILWTLWRNWVGFYLDEVMC